MLMDEWIEWPSVEDALYTLQEQLFKEMTNERCSTTEDYAKVAASFIFWRGGLWARESSKPDCQTTFRNGFKTQEG